MVEGAALEMLCGATHRGFESLSLRPYKFSDKFTLTALIASAFLHSWVCVGRITTVMDESNHP